MLNEKILFIGSLQWGEKSTGGGVQTKNQFFLKYIMSRTNDVLFYDTWRRKSFVALVMSIYYILFSKPNTPIILSMSSRGPYWIAKFCLLCHIKRRVYYWVAGGDLAIELENKSTKQRMVYRFFNKVVVQCNYLKKDLELLGINNCVVVPNFKPVVFKPKQDRQYGETTRIVFFSRIFKQKGVNEIIEAIKIINDKSICVDFYGALWPPYNKEYFDSLRDYNIKYKGFIDITETEGYHILSQYDFLLFPTYFVGEGFPGTLLDSFIAGVPAIVSDFHANKEVIEDGYNGIIIPPKDQDALIKSILTLSKNKYFLAKLRNNAIKSASKYEVKFVLNKAFEKLEICI